MRELIIYLIKVSAGLGIIFLPYYFLFRNDPNLFFKRIYLLVGVIAAWVFPLIAFQKPDVLLNLYPVVFIDPDMPEVQPFQILSSGSTQGITINWIQVLIITYLSGSVFLFLKNIFIVLKWNFTWKRTKKDNGVAFTTNDQVFTIFSKIFIPRKLQDEQDLDNVLLHEKAHVQQLHSIDLTLMELTLLLTWFNPFSWLISRMIKENHEHLADRQVLSTGVNPARYRAQLLNHTLGVNVFRLGNQFNHSLTIKRFNMMKKPKKSPTGMFKIALMIPAVVLMLAFTTGMTPQQKPIKGKVVLADCGDPAIGASVVIRNGTTGSVVDVDGTFSLTVDGDPELVFSFVGYASKIVSASKIGKKPIELERETFKVDLESVPDQDDKVILTPKETKAVLDGENAPQNDEPVFYIVEDMPMFRGGKAELKKYITTNLKYPASAANNKDGGEVMVQFLVTTSGSLEDIRVAKTSDKGLNKAAMDVFKDMPDWKPGKQRGKPVKVQVIVPVRFKADKE